MYTGETTRETKVKNNKSDIHHESMKQNIPHHKKNKKPFNVLFSNKTWVRWCQKHKASLNFDDAIRQCGFVMTAASAEASNPHFAPDN